MPHPGELLSCGQDFTREKLKQHEICVSSDPNCYNGLFYYKQAWIQIFGGKKIYIYVSSGINTGIHPKKLFK